ncbi:hypothetical protein H4R34_003717 [Dimargaris verticillata]|uniref:Uncharacterized protein n=1 Tax=Dimargaris verticillata TaxID=2761393 RepID=A0A9W8AZH4_9FUNG|nr:hypothetical protein H4R34_003717 [Dimargaris verticillata]
MSTSFELVDTTSPDDASVTSDDPFGLSTIHSEFTTYDHESVHHVSARGTEPVRAIPGSPSSSAWLRPRSDTTLTSPPLGPTDARPELSGSLWKPSWRRWSPILARVFQLSITYFVVPFFQGIMLGFGEICANELAFRWGWRNITIAFPQLRPTRPKPPQEDKPTKATV